MKNKLLAFGCSYTAEDWSTAEIDCSFPRWPELLAKKLNLQHENLGSTGGSNDKIFRLAVDKIVNEHEKIKTICILWTSIWRYELFNDNFTPNSTWERSTRGLQGVKLDDPSINNRDRAFWEINDKVFTGYYDKFENENQFHIYKIETFLKNIITLQKLCNTYNIEMYQWCAFPLINFARFYKLGGKGAEYDVHTEHKLKTNMLLLYNDLLGDYSNQIDKKNIIGFPWEVPLKGSNFGLYILNGGKMENKNKFWIEKVVSINDTHPNSKGHTIIADMFYYKITGEKYNAL